MTARYTALVQRDGEPDVRSRTFAERVTDRWPSMAPAVEGFDGRVAVVLGAASLILLVYRKFGRATTFEGTLRPESLAQDPYLSLYGDAYWFLTSLFLLGLLPFLLLRIPRLAPSRSGVGLGDWRFGLKVLVPTFVAMVVIVAVASRFDVFSGYYPLNAKIGEEAAHYFGGTGGAPEAFLGRFLAYELLYGLYFVGWEYFFRGFLLFGLYDRLGMNGILVGNIPFALLHVSKPFPEALGSIVAGLALGVFALRTRSFWYPCLLHVGVAWTMDAAAIQRRAEILLERAAG